MLSVECGVLSVECSGSRVSVEVSAEGSGSRKQRPGATRKASTCSRLLLPGAVVGVIVESLVFGVEGSGFRVEQLE